MSTDMVRIENGKEVSVGNAALTMAIAIIVERVSRLSQEDQNDLYDLVKSLREVKTEEDREAIRVAMTEILDCKTGGITPANFGQPAQRSEKLAKWVDYISQRVQQLRKEAGMTQEQLAEKSGLPQSHISRIESAKLSPSNATLVRIAGALSRPISDLDPSA